MNRFLPRRELLPVSIRTRFVAFFTLLAVIPLIGIGAWGYVQSLAAVRAQVAKQVEGITRNAAAQLRERYLSCRSNLLLLAENAETQSLFAARIAGDSGAVAKARLTALPYFEQAWDVLGEGYAWIELRDREGRVVHRLGEEPQPAFLAQTAGWPGQDGLLLEEAIVEPQSGERLGAVVAAVNRDIILPYEALQTRFGSAGYSMVLDRTTGRILYHPRHAYWQRTLRELGRRGLDLDPAVLEEPQGRVDYQENDSARVAFFESLESPPWTVLAAGSVDEFGAPYSRTRVTTLVLIVLLAIAVASAYTLMTRKATDSLVALTAAADRVGAGDYGPALPAGGRDEVGRLAHAFQLMTGKLRESREQLEASRQMAAVGEFASQISHEIRNPLTSLNLNLQGLSRQVERGRIPADLARPVDLCMKEVQRLDRVVRGVLRLARSRAPATRTCSVHQAIESAFEVLQAQAEASGVVVHTTLLADQDGVQGDPEALESVFLNLFLNAVEAMPSGGELCVSSDNHRHDDGCSWIRIGIADDGPGIPLEVGDRIFAPFYSTKRDGTGLGLSLAARIVEEHHGLLTLASPTASGRGSEFIIELPLASGERSA